MARRESRPSRIASSPVARALDGTGVLTDILSAMLDALHSPRLTLEPLLASHAAMLIGSVKDAALYEHAPEEPPVSLSTLAKRYGWFESRRSPDGSEDWLNWAVRISDGDRPYVGYVQATIRAHRSADIAYFVFAAFQGHGYGREAVGAMVDFLIDKADVRSIKAHIDSRNKRSMALVKSLGFRKVEVVETADHLKGRVSDKWIYRRAPGPGSGVDRGSARALHGAAEDASVRRIPSEEEPP